MENLKYKDLSPIETVKRAQSVLNEIGMVMDESLHHQTSNLYSMRLQCKKLNWGTNGKGTTEEFCRASAYGEVMERIENMHFPDDYFDSINDCGFKKEPFKYFPDEIRKTLDFKKLNQYLKQDMAEAFHTADGYYADDKELESLYNEWNGSSQYTFLPFFNVVTDEEEYLPFEIVRRLCRSNGLASGNTIEEAICQGISEVLERYSQKYISVNQLTPPPIPIEYIKETSLEIYDTICEIENKGFSILILDASLGKGLPVVCTILIDQKTQRYKAKFGSHPVFRIALERCFTEMAQGYDFSQEQSAKQMIKFDMEEHKNWDTFYNWSANFRSNSGAIPLSFFYDKPSWIFQKWNMPNYTNEKGCHYLLDICLSLSPNVYIRNNSFLGFPAVRIYVPDIGVPYKFNPLGRKTYLNKNIRTIISSFPQKCNTLSSEEKHYLCKIFERDYHFLYKENLGVSVNVLLAALYAEDGNLQKAIDSLNKEENKTQFVKAVICELGMLAENIPEDNRNSILQKFFGKNLLTYIILNWRRHDITNNLLDPYCANRLRSKIFMDHDNRQALFAEQLLRIKECMSKTCIKQIL